MMKLALLLVLVPLAAQHQHVSGMHEPTGYAGLETRELKVYSDEEVQSLERGEGMGYAMVAELLHYPGPKHVLELASELELSPEQRLAAQSLYDEMHAEAVRLGRQLLENERALQDLFSRGDPASSRDLVTHSGELESKLRWTHLEAHIRMHALLDPGQRRRYDELRGYEMR